MLRVITTVAVTHDAHASDMCNSIQSHGLMMVCFFGLLHTTLHGSHKHHGES